MMQSCLYFKIPIVVDCYMVDKPQASSNGRPVGELSSRSVWKTERNSLHIKLTDV